MFTYSCPQGSKAALGHPLKAHSTAEPHCLYPHLPCLLVEGADPVLWIIKVLRALNRRSQVVHSLQRGSLDRVCVASRVHSLQERKPQLSTLTMTAQKLVLILQAQLDRVWLLKLGPSGNMARGQESIFLFNLMLGGAISEECCLPRVEDSNEPDHGSQECLSLIHTVHAIASKLGNPQKGETQFPVAKEAN